MAAASEDADSDSETIKKSAPNVSGEQLELMLTEWDTPLVIDAYATWYVLGAASRGRKRFWRHANRKVCGYFIFYNV